MGRGEKLFSFLSKGEEFFCTYLYPKSQYGRPEVRFARVEVPLLHKSYKLDINIVFFPFPRKTSRPTALFNGH